MFLRHHRSDTVAPLAALRTRPQPSEWSRRAPSPPPKRHLGSPRGVRREGSRARRKGSGVRRGWYGCVARGAGEVWLGGMPRGERGAASGVRVRRQGSGCVGGRTDTASCRRQAAPSPPAQAASGADVLLRHPRSDTVAPLAAHRTRPQPTPASGADVLPRPPEATPWLHSRRTEPDPPQRVEPTCSFATPEATPWLHSRPDARYGSRGMAREVWLGGYGSEVCRAGDPASSTGPRGARALSLVESATVTPSRARQPRSSPRRAPGGRAVVRRVPPSAPPAGWRPRRRAG